MKLLSAALLSAAVFFAVAPPATAAAIPAVQITRVQYDSPGVDNRSAASLNAEWIRLTNTTKAPISLRGWTVRDASAHVYTFGAYSLGAGRAVVIRTGSGGDTAVNRYWKSGAYIWNNDRDTAAVRNAAGRAIDSCTWTRPGPGYSFC